MARPALSAQGTRREAPRYSYVALVALSLLLTNHRRDARVSGWAKQTSAVAWFALLVPSWKDTKFRFRGTLFTCVDHF